MINDALSCAPDETRNSRFSSRFSAARVSSPLVEFNGGSGAFRNVPDVAAVADPNTGVGIYLKDFGGWIQIGGTSASSPIWAGYMSIVNAGGDFLGIGHVGFLDPLLYYTGTNFYGNNDALPAGLGVWYQIVDGSNGNFNLYGLAGYSAGQYYNNCCGLGSLFGPYAYQLLSALTVTSSLNPANLKAVPTTTTATITWKAVSGASGYGVYVDVLSPVGNPITSFDLTGSALATVTKKTSIKLSGLSPKGYYGIFVSAIDGSNLQVGTSTIEFQTK